MENGVTKNIRRKEKLFYGLREYVRSEEKERYELQMEGMSEQADMGELMVGSGELEEQLLRNLREFFCP